MSKLNDLTGRKFGMLTVISKAESIKGRTMWNCTCDCGNEKIIASASLTSGRTISCGCKNKKKDISGKIFGKLTVLGFDGYVNKNPKWKCQCECGKIVSVFENGLKNGATKNCGSIIHRKYIGKKFGRLTVQAEAEKGTNNKSAKYLCKCDCGNFLYVPLSNLKSGNTKSCGCLSKEITSERNKTHGLSKTRIYNIWIKIKERCDNEKSTSYNKYGAKGIKVCSEWYDFQTFYNWAITNGYNDNLTIDRINGAGNYEPNNCRWATYKQQANNLKTNVIVEYKGESKTLGEWSEKYNIPYKVLYNRYKKLKWDFERALTEPIRKQNKG